MIVATWNIRGFHLPLKHKGVSSLLRKQKIDIFGLLETKLNSSKVQHIMRTNFPGWSQVNNFHSHNGGRILVIWDSSKVQLEPMMVSPQAIHCLAKCKITSVDFHISFVYAFNSTVARRPLWDFMTDFGTNQPRPWLIVGDFNNVLSAEEKQNGAAVTPYEIRDFTECCQRTGITDLQSSGCFFTWTNNAVWCKLDRAMVNNAWMLSNLSGHAKFLLQGSLSDHTPCIVSILQQGRNTSNKPFRFSNMWTKHDEFQNVVHNVWNQNIDGTSQFALCRKLKSLKLPLKQLDALHFSHISSRANSAKIALEEAQDRFHNDPDNDNLRIEVMQLRKKAHFLSAAELDFYFQQAKSSYLKHGDKCTKFFHTTVKRNKKKNFIAAVNKADGSLTTSEDQVAEEFIRYFQSLLGTSSITESIDISVLQSGPVLSSSQGLDLLRTISDTEIKQAVFSIGDEKSPGPDGFNACFFKKSWSIVGQQLCEAVKEFFATGSLLKQLNHTIIALVPKSSHASSVGDFRPIACCNVVYKVISKIIAARLAPLLGSLVDPAQSAFIEGRSMIENIYLAQELLRKYNRKRISPRCMIKVDLKKAFDSVNWGFIAEILKGLNFPSRFINWVMVCVSTPSYSISLNGNVHGFFKGHKGLRQGDPLSPFLFVLCLEYLSRLLKVATNDSEFNHHPRCAQLKITHLAFADDLILVSRGDPASVKILMDCLHNFGNKSGLRANTLKSNLYTAGIYGQDLDDIQILTNIPVGTMPFRYLGIPLAAERLTVMHYAPFLDKIAAYINSWTASSLSYAGRMELIRSVLQGVECFWLSIMPIPAIVIDRVTRLCRQFLWNSSHSPVSWKEACLPKAEGGLGFRDLKSWNSALLAKCLWNFHRKSDTLWVRWVQHVYLGTTSLWDWIPKRDDSPLLKRILLIRDTIRQRDGSTAAAMQRIDNWSNGNKFKAFEAYDFFRFTGTHMGWATTVWNSSITPKHSFILWLAAKGKLHTKDRMHFMNIDDTCVLCNHGHESLQHIFFQCSISRDIWQFIKTWLGLHRSMTTIASSIKWIKKSSRKQSKQGKAQRIGLACTVYMIWNARNRKIFEDCSPNIADICFKIKSHVYKVLYTLYPDNSFLLQQ